MLLLVVSTMLFGAQFKLAHQHHIKPGVIKNNRTFCTIKLKTTADQTLDLLWKHDFVSCEKLLKDQCCIPAADVLNINQALAVETEMVQADLQKYHQLKQHLSNSAIMSLGLPLTGPVLAVTLQLAQVCTESGITGALSWVPVGLGGTGLAASIGLVGMGGTLYSIGIVTDENFIPLKKYALSNHLESINKLSNVMKKFNS